MKKIQVFDPWIQHFENYHNNFLYSLQGNTQFGNLVKQREENTQYISIPIL